MTKPDSKASNREFPCPCGRGRSLLTTVPMPVTSYADDPVDETWRLDCPSCAKIYRTEVHSLATTKGPAWVLADDYDAWAKSWQELTESIALASDHHRRHHLAAWQERFAGLSGAATVRLINEALPHLALSESAWRRREKAIGHERALAALFEPVEAIRPIKQFLQREDAVLEALVSRYEESSERHRATQARLERGAVSCRGRGSK